MAGELKAIGFDAHELEIRFDEMVRRHQAIFEKQVPGDELNNVLNAFSKAVVLLIEENNRKVLEDLREAGLA